MTPTRTVSKQDVLAAARKRWPEFDYQCGQRNGKWIIQSFYGSSVMTLEVADTLDELLRKIEAE